MVMDQSFGGLYGSDKGLDLGGEYGFDLSSKNRNDDDDFRLGTNGKFVDQKYSNLLLLPPEPIHLQSDLAPNQEEGGAHEDFDFSDVVLKYISQMLMEEDMEDKACMFQESAALQVQEQSFYELIGQKYPLPDDDLTIPCADQQHESPDYSLSLQDSNCSISTSTSSSASLVDPGWNFDPRDYKSPQQVASQCTSHSSYGFSNGAGNVVDGFVDSPMSTLRVHEAFNEIESVMQFKRGFEEASKFIPNADSLIVDLESYKLFSKELKDSKDMTVGVEKKYESEYFLDGSRGKKNLHREDVALEEGRSNKQSAFCSESNVSSDMFDMVLLSCGKNDSSLYEVLQNGAIKNSQQTGQSKGTNGGKSRGKKQGVKRDVVDLRTLLTLCAQSVAADDRRRAEEFLKQIRQHSSPTGDGMQRMAQCFADGLEARMAGSGTQIYKALITRPTSAADVLKAYHLFLAACPFRKLSNFFSNKTIMNVAEKATRLHIIDFGILYGFQWPCLIQRLSSRPEGPPRLRITGIDFPQPGFRPAERVEETGRRLASYAETFKVPFEFNAIAQKWDTIQIEDLKLDRDEVLVVNSVFRLRNLLDETVVVDSPRDIVLNLIKKMNPDVFILGTVNGAYNTPFFITRFREALFHFSTMFDMLETNVPREIPERMLIEREIFGREAMNVIACEGFERIERPETYKQWQVRILRAGFRLLPLNQGIVQMAEDRVQSNYHKDFVINKDGGWLLQGWKGRIVYALSSWGPA